MWNAAETQGQIYAPYTADLTATTEAANNADVGYPVFNAQAIAWAVYLNSLVALREDHRRRYRRRHEWINDRIEEIS